MILDTCHPDVLIIGSGIAGSIAAATAARNGKKVLVLDKAKSLSQSDAEAFSWHKTNLNFNQIDSSTLYFQQKNAQKQIELPNALGGLARFFGAVMLRMKELEFEHWPIHFSEIEPYYQLVEQLIHVNVPKNNISPLGTFSNRILKGAQHLGIQPFQHPLAINFDTCLRCSKCNGFPCPTSARWHPERLLQHPNITVQQGVHVDKILWEKKARKLHVKGIQFSSPEHTKTFTIEAKSYMLAAGAFGTPCLLQASAWPDKREIIGRYLMLHTMSTVISLFRNSLNYTSVFNKRLSIDDFYFSEKRGVRGIIQEGHPFSLNAFGETAVKYLTQPLSPITNRIGKLLVIGQDDPQVQNRVFFDPSKQKVLVSHAFSTADLEKNHFIAEKAKAILKSAGGLTSITRTAKSPYHACGTVRMGTDHSNSAVDKNGLLWGSDNLLICDASLFPTSSGVNPSLTIAANAMRIADKWTSASTVN